MSMRICPFALIMGGMATRRKQRPRVHPIQYKVPSRFENATQVRIDRNRRGRAACDAAIKARRKET